jgi:hypothetical protein
VTTTVRGLFPRPHAQPAHSPALRHPGFARRAFPQMTQLRHAHAADTSVTSVTEVPWNVVSAFNGRSHVAHPLPAPSDSRQSPWVSVAAELSLTEGASASMTLGVVRCVEARTGRYLRPPAIPPDALLEFTILPLESDQSKVFPASREGAVSSSICVRLAARSIAVPRADGRASTFRARPASSHTRCRPDCHPVRTAFAVVFGHT